MVGPDDGGEVGGSLLDESGDVRGQQTAGPVQSRRPEDELGADGLKMVPTWLWSGGMCNLSESL